MNEAVAISSAPEMPLGERRHVSVLFADMVGYTSIIERLGEEGALAFTRMIYQRLVAAVQRHGGFVHGLAGDSVMAVFGMPEAREDAALRACRAALAIQDSFSAAAQGIEAQFGVRPAMRAGVTSGLAVMAPLEGAGAPLAAVGATVNLASRVQALAEGGACLICDATRRLVEWRVELSFAGEHALRGVAKPHKLWRLVAIREGANRFDASRARGLSPYVGRIDELATLADALVAARKGLGVIDVVGEPGLGKTRLAFEFLQRMQPEDALVLSGACTPDGQQVPFLPFLDVVRGSFRIRDETEPQEIARKLEAGLRASGLFSTLNLALLLNLLGLSPPTGALAGMDGVLIGLRTRDLLPALLEACCRAGPVVLMLEDIHWIDGASEDLLRVLIESGAQSNLLVLHTRRPEYAPPWRDASNVATVALKPLAEGDIRRLAQARLGVETLPDALAHQLTERAGGNPLFGEEILSFLIDRGALSIDAGEVRFDAGLEEHGLPASLQTLLAARMDRLPPEDRALLQAAAAIGRRFDPGLLSLVAGDPAGTGAALLRLEAQDVVSREPGSSDYVFRHALWRDAVYEGLVTGRRAALHLSIAEALETRNAGRLSEAAETLAHHYGFTDRTERAFRYNALAGSKSLGVYSLGEAERYFATALALHRRAPGCVGEDQLASCLTDYALCLNLSLQVEGLIRLAEEARPTLDRLGDSRHHALFLHHHVAGLVWNGRYRDALAASQELTAMARRLDDPVSHAYALVSELAVSCYHAPLPRETFEARRGQAEALLARLDDAYLQNFFLAHMGWAEICSGRVAEARRAAERMITDGMSKGDPRSLGYGTAMQALIAMLSDDYEVALDLAERALAVSRAEFERTIAGLARSAALLPLRRPDAAAEVRRFMQSCAERGGALFESAPEPMIGVALAMDGRIAEGVRHVQAMIAAREAEGRQSAADWCRLFLCEIYLEILSGKGGVAPGVLLRNLRTLARVLLRGERLVVALTDAVRANPQFDREGHYIGRVEMALGLLHKAKGRAARARRHLDEARRIIGPAGPSPMLARIETALTELGAAR